MTQCLCLLNKLCSLAWVRYSFLQYHQPFFLNMQTKSEPRCLFSNFLFLFMESLVITFTSLETSIFENNISLMINTCSPTNFPYLKENTCVFEKSLQNNFCRWRSLRNSKKILVSDRRLVKLIHANDCLVKCWRHEGGGGEKDVCWDKGNIEWLIL